MGNISRRQWLTVCAAAGPYALLDLAGCGQRAPQVAVTTPAVAPVVRVRLLQSVSSANLSATRPPTLRPESGPAQSLNVAPGAAIVIKHSASGWKVGSVRLPPGDLSIEPEIDGSVNLAGQAYRGTLHLVAAATPTAFDVVNHVDVDAYLKGVLAKEMLPEFLPETYQAQAIVARTYALYEWRHSPAGRAWDLYPDTRSQMYGGIAAESAKSRSAVEKTPGVVVAYGKPGQEKIFKAYFSSCCGGAGQSAAQAFGDPIVEPLTDQAVGTRCAKSPRFNWGPIVISRSELTRRFRLFGVARSRPERDIGTLAKIDIARRNPSGRPVQFTVTDVRGARYLLSGEELRLAVNTDAAGSPANTTQEGSPATSPVLTLHSSFVRPVADAGNIRFEEGHGFGHGVGMCQWCAQAQAEQGIPHEQIVVSAFHGSRLVQAY